MSRVPVREAVKTLEAQGILRSQPHRGAYIVPLDDARIDRICEARLALERLALPGAVAALEVAPARLRELDAVIARRNLGQLGQVRQNCALVAAESMRHAGGRPRRRRDRGHQRLVSRRGRARGRGARPAARSRHGDQLRQCRRGLARLLLALGRPRPADQGAAVAVHAPPAAGDLARCPIRR